MVVGLPRFEEHFKKFQDCFVIIGGTACSILFGEENLKFRATKDIDMVLILDEINSDFSKAFWGFIEMGEYSLWEKSKDLVSYYRFLKPKKPDFPFQIELFSRKPDSIRLSHSQKIVPVKIEDAKSLSAILLNDDYYGCLKEGIRVSQQLNILDKEYVILFKMKAFVDLSERKERGENVNEKDIKKHKYDVFRLLEIISGETRVAVPSTIIDDVNYFIARVQKDPPDFKNLNIKLKLEEAIELLSTVFIPKI